MPDPRETSETSDETAAEVRQTPGEAALAQKDRAEVDRYVDWQHDPETEYVNPRH